MWSSLSLQYISLKLILWFESLLAAFATHIKKEFSGSWNTHLYANDYILRKHRYLTVWPCCVLGCSKQNNYFVKQAMHRIELAPWCKSMDKHFKHFTSKHVWCRNIFAQTLWYYSYQFAFTYQHIKEKWTKYTCIYSYIALRMLLLLEWLFLERLC